MRYLWDSKMQCAACKRVQMAAAVAASHPRGGTVGEPVKPCTCGATSWAVVDPETPVTPDASTPAPGG